MYEYNAVITNVVDGDTYDVDIDLGFHIHIHERVRVLDLDTLEKRGTEKELGLICYNWARMRWLDKSVILKSEEEIKAPKTDSFGRWLCRIWPQGESLDIEGTFSSLGCNKYLDNYNEENVRLLQYDYI